MRRVPAFAIAWLLLVTSVVADGPKPILTGPAIAAVGQEIRLSVEGLPSPDLSSPEGLKPVIAWASKIVVSVDSPVGAEPVVESDITLNLGAGGVKLRLSFAADKPGTYVVILLDGNSVQVATRRITVGPVVPQPDPPPGPGPNPVPDPNKKPTAVTYVFEKDQGPVPRPVQSALNKIHGESSGVVASLFEDDSTTGGGAVPKQYQVPLKAAREAGLPCLVVTSGDVVLRTVKAPTTEAQVLEAAK